MQFFKSVTVVLVATFLVFNTGPIAVQQQNVENVILVTIDGLRWQELFGGADQRLINKEDGNVEQPQLTRERFWHDDSLERRQLLMPFFWNEVARRGQVFGSPDHGSSVTVKNGHCFSYPGYNEILTGFGDPKIDSNNKRYNENVTVLEWLNRKPEFKDQVAAFCSWDVFPFIINDTRSGIPVNAGWMPLEHFEDELLQKTYNALADQLPKYWLSVRYDAFTFRGAMEYLKTNKPRVLYLALGETDDWAHAGRYDLYLESARQNDDFIRQIWEYTQSSEHYRGKTALVIATDHGRGDDRVGWKSHHAGIPGSDRIWISVLGPNVEGLGLRTNVNGTQGQVASTVAALLGYDFTKFDRRIEPPLELTDSNADVPAVWQMMEIDSDASLRGLHVVGESVVWASGSGGTIIHTTDGGAHWNVQIVPGAEKLDFRDIHAIDEKTIVAITSGTPARIYRSTDGGSSWAVTYENKDEKVFLDALSFFDKQQGVVMGDPIDGSLFLLQTTDGGKTWKQNQASPATSPGEAGFAASGTNMIVVGKQKVMIALGGAETGKTATTNRVLFSGNRGADWSAGVVPMVRSPSAGIFSLCFSSPDNGVAVGGDYLKQDATTHNYAVTRDGGKTWSVPKRRQPPSGYRSCVAAWINEGRPEFIAVGPNGTDRSTDLGNSWHAISKTGFHAIEFSPDGKQGWATGGDGRVAKWMGD